jgi:hypothetical protein
LQAFVFVTPMDPLAGEIMQEVDGILTAWS